MFMYKKFIALMLLLIAICFSMSACTKPYDDDIDNGSRREKYTKDILSDSISKKSFADSYYFSMLYSPANGWRTQSDVTYLLTRYINDDLKKNKQDSRFNFLRNTKTPFFYTDDTALGKEAIYFLISKDGEDVYFPKAEFIPLIMFFEYDGDYADDLDSYKLEVFVNDDVTFNDTTDFINYLNSDDHNNSIFFERGWLEIS